MRGEPCLVRGSLYSRWRPVAEDLMISLYITNRSVGLFVRGQRGETHATTLGRLYTYEPALGEALGAPLRCGVACCHLTDCKMSTTDPAAWPQAFEWLHAREGEYGHVLASHLAGMN